MRLPEAFLQSLEGATGYSREAFTAIHEAGEAPTSVRINVAKRQSAVGDQSSAIDNRQTAISNEATSLVSLFTSPVSPSHHSLLTTHHSPLTSPVPWCRTGYYLGHRPSFTFDPLFHAGCYYVQEASSMFLEQAFRQLLPTDQPLKVLDLCAAPGGKSTHIQSLLAGGSLLVSNEVIRQRSYVLSDNIIKWGGDNVFVTNNDPKAFQKLPGFFDVLVVDAPCSGSGLFRKDPEAITEWSPNNVALCSQRQQRILADVLACLKEDGLLIYSTCSYSTEEDEEIMDWLVEEMAMENRPLNTTDFSGVITTASATGAVGYRFYPDKVKGEGFFMACFKKKEGSGTLKYKASKPELVTAKERTIAAQWLEGGYELLKFREEIVALPPHLLTDFMLLQAVLTIQYAGIFVGTVLKDKLVPHHALAQSNSLSGGVPYVEAGYDEAIKYLQRSDLQLSTPTTGWQVVKYGGYALGWVNALKNRVNNYYPKELRILKAQNNTSFRK